MSEATATELTISIMVETVETGFSAWAESGDFHAEGYGNSPGEAAAEACKVLFDNTAF